MAGDVGADDVRGTGAGSPKKALAALLHPAAIDCPCSSPIRLSRRTQSSVSRLSVPTRTRTILRRANGRRPDIRQFSDPYREGRHTNRMKAVQRREKSDLRQRQAIGFHAS